MDLKKDLNKEILKDVSLEEIAPKPKAPETPAQRWTTPVLAERLAYLNKMARLDKGEASETIRSFPGHKAVLVYRHRDGKAEIHARHADLFFVQSGSATLVSGGEIVDAQVTKPDEIRGKAITGGTEQPMRPGDVLHIPAGVPHQMKVSSEEGVSCFLMKIEEPKPAI
jgi:mannose-6-phosphate isomerase-like protein (cupin superfamily)